MEKLRCFNCNSSETGELGNGQCGRCNGTGTMLHQKNGIFYRILTGRTHGQSECSSCKGTGICSWCDGVGVIDESLRIYNIHKGDPVMNKPVHFLGSAAMMFIVLAVFIGILRFLSGCWDDAKDGAKKEWDWLTTSSAGRN